MYKYAMADAGHAQQILLTLHWFGASQVKADRERALAMMLDIQIQHPNLF